MIRCFVMALTLLVGGPALATSYFTRDIPISGIQQVPSVFVDGIGSYDLNYIDTAGVLCWNITFDQLSGPATAIHFHGAAAVGTNAGVQIDVGAESGLTSPIEDCVVISAAQGADLLNGLWYLNIHTDANPGGEIRGQAIGLEEADSGIQTRARVLTGLDAVDAVGGQLDASGGDHIDCYCMSVSDSAAFYVTTDPAIDPAAASEIPDTRLWLWNYDGDQIISGNDDSPGQGSMLSVIADPDGPINYPQTPQNPVQRSIETGDAVLACISYFDNTPIDALGLPLVDFGTSFETLNGPNPAAGPFDRYIDSGADGLQAYNMAIQGARACDARYEVLHNPSFSRSVQYWSAPSGVGLTWRSDDGHLTENGSAQLTVSSAPDAFEIEQCIDARHQPEDALYLVEVSAKLPTDGDVQINVISYATSDCQAQSFFTGYGYGLSGVASWRQYTALVERSDLDFHLPSSSYKIQFTAAAHAPGFALVDDVSFQNVRIFSDNFD